MTESVSEAPSALIGDIYDAAPGPALWPDVIGKATYFHTHFRPGMTGALFAKDAIGRSGNFYYYEGGIDPDCKQISFS
jgi:hypothetical protein